MSDLQLTGLILIVVSLAWLAWEYTCSAPTDAHEGVDICRAPAVGLSGQQVQAVLVPQHVS